MQANQWGFGPLHQHSVVIIDDAQRLLVHVQRVGIPRVTCISNELLSDILAERVSKHILPHTALHIRHLKQLDYRLVLLGFLYIFLRFLDYLYLISEGVDLVQANITS
jgi:hypothetical protein